MAVTTLTEVLITCASLTNQFWSLVRRLQTKTPFNLQKIYRGQTFVSYHEETNNEKRIHFLEQWFSKAGSWVSSISWELVKNENSNRIRNRNTGGRAQQSLLQQTLQLRFEIHCSMIGSKHRIFLKFIFEENKSLSPSVKNLLCIYSVSVKGMQPGLMSSFSHVYKTIRENRSRQGVKEPKQMSEEHGEGAGRRWRQCELKAFRKRKDRMEYGSL